MAFKPKSLDSLQPDSECGNANWRDRVLVIELMTLQDLSLHCRHKTFTQQNDKLVTFPMSIYFKVNSFNTHIEYLFLKPHIKSQQFLSNLFSSMVFINGIQFGMIKSWSNLVILYSYIAQWKEHWHMSTI